MKVSPDLVKKNSDSLSDNLKEKEKEMLAQLGVRERIDVALEREEPLEFDPTTELVLKIGNSEIVLN